MEKEWRFLQYSLTRKLADFAAFVMERAEASLPHPANRK
jgi:hypothetical protein